MGDEGETATFSEDEERPVGETPENAYSIGRLLSFSDGVFAIAVTLLILDIPVPVLTQAAADADLADALLKLYPRLLAFTISFFVAGLYWVRHHQLFRGVIRADVPLLWLNLLLLFLVCAVPFTTGVFARYTDANVAVQVYCGNLAAVGVAFTLIRVYVQFRRMLRTEPSRREQQALVVGAFALPAGIIAFIAVLNFLPAAEAVGVLIGALTLVNVVRRFVARLPDRGRQRAASSRPPRGGGSGGRAR
ncbi:MAG TPA: TMEM175 family protein [Candidatus Dormibacteraeota bacterium]|jgi:uncharacterized membrane protein|nr:TMEM175 family protein [Candidatus Dormibacteraeota bacterium]